MAKKVDTVEIVSPVTLPATKGAYDIESFISLAIEHGNVDSLERLLAMRKELRAEWAKAQYDAAMAAFQLECPPVQALKPGHNYTYAPLEDLVEYTKVLRAKYGFSYTFKSETDLAEKSLTAICIIHHKDGHEESSPYKTPAGTGTPMQDIKQVYAGAYTFACRYAFKRAFGLVEVGEDDEKRIHNYQEKLSMAGPPTPAEMSTMLSLVEQAGFTTDAIAKRFNVASVTDMSRDTCLYATSKLKGLLDKKEATYEKEEVIPGLND